MRICLLNATDIGSTGSIVDSLAKTYLAEHHTVMAIFGRIFRKEAPYHRIETLHSKTRLLVCKIISQAFGLDGFVNSCKTRKVLKQISRFKPDLLHVHNLHGEWINSSLIFAYAKNNSIPIVATAHDCWWATGRCAHYLENHCEQYHLGCGHCKYRSSYPKGLCLDQTAKIFRKKREMADSIKLFFSPSKWLKDQLLDANLKSPFKVVGNPYDPDVFFAEKESSTLPKTPTIGFCSFSWSSSKGLEMAQILSQYYLNKGVRVIFIGLDSSDARLPKGAMGIARTRNQAELRALYNQMDCFVNPTKIDIYSMVNLESAACGTPVVTAKTGGAYEMIASVPGCHLVTSYSKEAFIEAIDEVLSKAKRIEPSSLPLNLQKENYGKIMLNYYNKVIQGQ